MILLPNLGQLRVDPVQDVCHSLTDGVDGELLLPHALIYLNSYVHHVMGDSEVPFEVLLETLSVDQVLGY